MRVETKYNLGDKIWVVYDFQGEVHVYEDKIIEICVSEKKGIIYLPDSCTDDIEEKDIILYEDTEKLVKEIKRIMQEIKEKEGNK